MYAGKKGRKRGLIAPIFLGFILVGVFIKNIKIVEYYLNGEDTLVRSILQPIKCLKCQELNFCGNLYCSRCGFTLDQKKEEIMMKRLMKKIKQIEGKRKK